jgi:hypothetical protein
MKIQEGGMDVYRTDGAGDCPSGDLGTSSGVNVLSLGMAKLGSIFFFLAVSYAVAVVMAICEVVNGRLSGGQSYRNRRSGWLSG